MLFAGCPFRNITCIGNRHTYFSTSSACNFYRQAGTADIRHTIGRVYNIGVQVFSTRA